jgi:hypothetical protein
MADVIVVKHRRNWEWQVRDQNGGLMIRGRERSRLAARYQGYRTLFMLLAAGRQLVDLPRVATCLLPPSPEQDRPEAGASAFRFNSAQPKTDQSQ